ncbi:DNA cytosine methyltransferase [Alcaligenes aquatilis]|uniref:DNA (cytosine-5-)-methyltransferase n=1 Tax=Alcaligenes aquatilis TaxID=323284 RepID=A0ABY4NN62_9BURK|nr:DNA (cytosine-5-)-methyltransferase [Alcaligenes aquatilis]UQN37291.1 DNA cytosine methyltransferase [Alcaligenes aquatilis]
MFDFMEFFAGGGMVRAGLGSSWNCAFANDFDFKKSVTYQRNWGSKGELFVGDVRSISHRSLPTCDLAWASFPCQDLSLAGGGAGLKGERSGTFYPFWDLMASLHNDGRSPSIIAIENVVGTLTSHEGKDFSAICDAFSSLNYRFGVVVVDAALFVPQSRPRMFIIGVREDIAIPLDLLSPEPVLPFHTTSIKRACSSLSRKSSANLVWWNIPTPKMRTVTFADLIEDNPTSVEWHSPDETLALLKMMSALNFAKVEAAKRSGRKMVGTIYRRTRLENGIRTQRAEIRFDDIAGCLRTPSGGSSRQLIMVVDGQKIRTRLISSRETARLMGLPEKYKLPSRYNEAYHLTGDGVAVPVVRHLAAHIFEPVLKSSIYKKEKVA